MTKFNDFFNSQISQNFNKYRLKQGSPNYDPRAKSGPRSHFIRSAKTFC